MLRLARSFFQFMCCCFGACDPRRVGAKGASKNTSFYMASFAVRQDGGCKAGLPIVTHRPCNYSHSMVEGGFELISYTTRFTPFTLLMISLLTLPRNSKGRRLQSAVMPSVELTARKATTRS